MNRIFITGVNGFIGAALAKLLLQEQREVAVLLRAGSCVDRIHALLPKLNVFYGDMREIGGYSSLVAQFKPNAIIHLAWSGVQGKDRNSSIQVQNISASSALYELAERIGCDVFVGMGSQAEYGPTSGRINEMTPTRPTTVYGAAKLSTGLLLERLAVASGRHLAWLRLFSSYGPGDDPSWLLQYLTRTLLARGRPALTAAQQMWDYIYVDDVARAVMSVMDQRVDGIYNLGSGQAYKLEHVILKIRDLIDPRLPLGFGEVPYRPDQVMHLEADIARLKMVTGWVPKTTLDEGLLNVVEHGRMMV